MPAKGHRKQNAKSHMFRIRITENERVQFEQAAQQAGFPSISAWVRSKLKMQESMVAKIRAEIQKQKIKLAQVEGEREHLLAYIAGLESSISILEGFEPLSGNRKKRKSRYDWRGAIVDFLSQNDTPIHVRALHQYLEKIEDTPPLSREYLSTILSRMKRLDGSITIPLDDSGRKRRGYWEVTEG